MYTHRTEQRFYRSDPALPLVVVVVVAAAAAAGTRASGSRAFALKALILS